jgi:hypothetical protein
VSLPLWVMMCVPVQRVSARRPNPGLAERYGSAGEAR